MCIRDSNCYSDGFYEEGGCTVHFKQCTFTNVTRKIFWNMPRREVIHDEDGSIIGNTNLADIAGDSQTGCLLYTSPSPRDVEEYRMPSSA
eukprot:TRINITY_DN6237_c0_g1_i1.p2 TRINITY_DN6237_c0_g1~~TRINITY_DN6237_c0_g1_i1.p2  ORF type:complete len:103 (+),score=49.65 TRINITY_DN6237_c0_g1_i1:40-309(+)